MRIHLYVKTTEKINRVAPRLPISPAPPAAVPGTAAPKAQTDNHERASDPGLESHWLAAIDAATD
jgi:hypothetical protein